MVKHSYFENQLDTSLVTLAKAKKHLRVDADFTDEDDLIQDYIASAQIVCQNYIDRAIVSRDFVMEADSFDDIEFAANWDNDEIVSVEYYPAGETEKVLLGPEFYKLRKSNTVGHWLLKFTNAPAVDKRDDAVIVTVKQGWVRNNVLTTVPKPIVSAILLVLTDFYEKRENRQEGTTTQANSLLRPYRKW